MSGEYRVPKRQNAPLVFLIWDMDQVLCFFLPLVMGNIINQLTFGFLLGVVIATYYGYQSKKDENLRGGIPQMIWRAGFYFSSNKTLPDPVVKDYYS